MQFSNNALRDWQQGERAAFEALGFPTRKDEHWKYLHLREFVEQQFTAPQTVAPRVDIQPFIIPNTYRVVLVDGVFCEELSDLNGLTKGVHITSLSAACDVFPEQVLNHVLSFQGQGSRFAAYNAANLTEGLWLDLKPAVTVDKPLQLLFITSGEHKDLAQHPRLLMNIGEQATLTLMEEYVGLVDTTSLTNSVSQIRVGAAAELHHYKLQRESMASYHFANVHIQQDKDSAVSTQHFFLGAKIGRDDLHYQLNASGASCDSRGFYLAHAHQDLDSHSKIHHAVSHTHSRQLYKGIIAGLGHAVFNGKVYVEPHAQQIKAEQLNRNLLLAKNASVDTKPELEIYADDVECSHGATVGQLEEDALFYCQTRGIPLPTARLMLTQAFVMEMLENISDDVIAAYLQPLILKQLDQMSGQQGEHNG